VTQTDDNIFVSPEERPKRRYAVKTGHANRYDIPDPVTGKDRLWTRATTLCKVLQDSYHLDMWERRVIVKGMGLRHDLAMLAANLDVTKDKEKLQDIAAKAKDTAGGNIGSNMGTAFHDYAQRMDSGEDMSKERMSPRTRRTLEAYKREMQDNDVEVLPDLMERVVCVYDLGICGRLDRVLTSKWWNAPRIGDVKSQKTLDFGYLSVAMQLAIYTRADYMYNEDTGEWEAAPETDLFKGMVMHTPIQGDQDFCELHEIDLDKGWTCVKLATTIRSWRKQGKEMGRRYVNDFAWRTRILAAESIDDLSAVWKDANAVGEWTTSLEELGMFKREQLREEMGR